MSRASIALSNFADFRGQVQGVNITANVPLEPYLSDGEINIHLGRIARAANFARIRSVEFSRYSQSEDPVSVGIAGISGKDTAIAALTATGGAVRRIDPELDIPLPIGWLISKSRLSVGINFGHEDTKKAPVREAGPWARYLDTTISEGLRWGSHQSLLRRDMAGRAVLATAATVTPAQELIVNGGAGEAALIYGAGVAFYTVLASGIARAMNSSPRSHIFGPFSGELTAAIGLSVDRLALTHAYTRTHKFADVR